MGIGTQQGDRPPLEMVTQNGCAGCKALAQQMAIAWDRLNERLKVLEG